MGRTTWSAYKISWRVISRVRVFYNNTLAAGQSYVQQTYITHPWIVTDAAGACLGIWLPRELQDIALTN